LDKAWALGDWDAAEDGLGHHPAWLDMKACGLDFPQLVFGGLLGGRYTDVGKDAGHGCKTS
jgi:hypothetical protein